MENTTLTPVRTTERGEYVLHRADDIEAYIQENREYLDKFVFPTPEMEQHIQALKSEGGEFRPFSTSLIFVGEYDGPLSRDSSFTLNGGACDGMSMKRLHELFGEDAIHWHRGLTCDRIYVNEWSFNAFMNA